MNKKKVFFEVRPDYLVEKNDITYIAEVKTGLSALIGGSLPYATHVILALACENNGSEPRAASRTASEPQAEPQANLGGLRVRQPVGTVGPDGTVGRICTKEDQQKK